MRTDRQTDRQTDIHAKFIYREKINKIENFPFKLANNSVQVLVSAISRFVI